LLENSYICSIANNMS